MKAGDHWSMEQDIESFHTFPAPAMLNSFKVICLDLGYGYALTYDHRRSSANYSRSVTTADMTTCGSRPIKTTARLYLGSSQLARKLTVTPGLASFRKYSGCIAVTVAFKKI